MPAWSVATLSGWALGSWEGLGGSTSVVDDVIAWFAAITVYDPTIPGERVLYVGTHGYTTTPSDTPDNTTFDECITQAVNISRYLVGPGTVSGSARVAFGDLILSNADGALDRWLIDDYAFDGRPITLYRGPLGGAFPDDFVSYRLTMATAHIGRTVTIKLRERQWELNVPIQTNRYTALGSPIGQLKPVCVGSVKNVSAILIDPVLLIYQVHDGAIDSVSVYDMGIELDAGAPYADEAAMLATAPTAGEFRVWLGGGQFRLGSQSAGTITADVVEDASATAGSVFEALMLRAGYSPGEWDATDITALDAENSALIGDWITEERSVAQEIDAVLGSVHAAWFVDRYGVFRVKRITPGAWDSSLRSLTVHQMPRNAQLERESPRDANNGIPASVVALRYGRNFTVMDR